MTLQTYPIVYGCSFNYYSWCMQVFWSLIIWVLIPFELVWFYERWKNGRK